MAADAIPADMMGLDIGPASAQLYAEEARRHAHGLLERAHGRLQDGPFAEGTRRLAQALVDVTAQGALTVVGGGDSTRCASSASRTPSSDTSPPVVVTSLEYLEGKELPGIAILTKEH